MQNNRAKKRQKTIWAIFVLFCFFHKKEKKMAPITCSTVQVRCIRAKQISLRSASTSCSVRHAHSADIASLQILILISGDWIPYQHITKTKAAARRYSAVQRKIEIASGTVQRAPLRGVLRGRGIAMSDQVAPAIILWRCPCPPLPAAVSVFTTRYTAAAARCENLNTKSHT